MERVRGGDETEAQFADCVRMIQRLYGLSHGEALEKALLLHAHPERYHNLLKAIKSVTNS